MAQQCSATAKTTGRQCTRPAIPGGTVCRYHGGAAPQVKAAALRRLREAADPAAAELVRLALHGKTEGIRLGAIRELFARAGIGEADRLSVEVTRDRLVAEIERLEAEIAHRG